MIEVSGLSKFFGEIEALRSVSFTVEKGEIVGFLGANGAGKTTTMDIITGCLGPTHGQVRVCGHDVVEDAVEAKRHIGYLPDEPPLHLDMSIIEYLTYAAKLRGIPSGQLKDKVLSIMDRLEIGEMKDRLVGNLSKGYRQRVGLGQALVHDPDVLILDEPTEGLDPNQIIQIREMIKSLKGDHTILFSSHILSEVQSVCDKLIIINKGKIIAQGRYQDLMKNSEQITEYLIAVRRNGERLVNELKQLGGIDQIVLDQKDQNRFRFKLDKQKINLDDIARSIIDGNYGLLELSPKSKTLEDVFIQLTH